MKTLLLILFIFPAAIAFAQETKIIYDPNADAASDLNAAIQTAKEQQKNVLIQIGGNWCPWCHRLHQFFESDFKADSVIQKNYVVLRINYSKENKNLPVLSQLDYPQRFGFPVLVILNQDGNRIHTQDTGLLELDKGYDPEKVLRFLENWTAKAIDPASYQ